MIAGWLLVVCLGQVGSYGGCSYVPSAGAIVYQTQQECVKNQILTTYNAFQLVCVPVIRGN